MQNILSNYIMNKIDRIPKNTRRLYFMDVLRGVAIILVIYNHFFTYYLHTDSVFNNLCLFWRMPLFFFISGFFSYTVNCGADKIKKKVENRLYRQLYPTLIVCAIYLVCMILLQLELNVKEVVFHTIYDPAKRGYWFTFSLVQVFLAFMIVLYLFNRYKLSRRAQGIIIFCLTVASSIPAVTGFSSFDEVPFMRRFISVMSMEKTIGLLPFFLFGVLCRIYEKEFLQLMGKPVCFILAISFFGICSFFPSDIAYYLHRWFSLIAVISLFTIFREFFSTKSMAGRYLIRIGKQTLPIYLFHFFILLLLSTFAADLIDPFIRLINNPVVEIAIVGLLSVMVLEVVLWFDSKLSKWTAVHKLIYSY